MTIERYMAIVRNVWNRLGDIVLAGVMFAASLALYLQTLAPSVVTLFDDSLEFPLVAHRLAIAHPTGYPLYTLLGKLFTFGPWPNTAWGVNLLSAVAGAVTIACVYLVIRQLVPRRLAAALGAIALAVSPVFWSQAVIAEVYTLNSAFIAALLWLALRWAREPLRPVQPFSLLFFEPSKVRMLFLPGEGLWLRLPPAVRRVGHRLHGYYRRFFPAVPPKGRLLPHPLLYVLAVLFGLSLTHHRLAVLLFPTLLIFVALVEHRVLTRAALLGPEHPGRPRWLQFIGRPVTILVLCLLIPLLLYLYLPLRGGVGSLDGTYANTWRGFWAWVTASGYNVFFADNPLARDLDVGFYGSLFWQQFGPVGLALALVGVFGLVRRSEGRVRRLKALVLTGLAFLTYVAFAARYQVPDVEVFFVPAFLITAVWIGVGFDYALTLLRVRGQSLAVRRLLAVMSTLLIAAALLQPVIIAVQAYPDVDLSQNWLVHDYGRYLLAQERPAHVTVVGLLGEMTLLRYFQETENVGAGIDTVAADQEALRRQAVEDALEEDNPVFITRVLPGLEQAYALDALTGEIRVDGELESLIQVGAPDDTVPHLPRAVNQEVVPGLELLGYGLHEHQGHWQAWLRLRLWWRASRGLAAPFKVSARLVDARGQMVAVVDADPVSGAYPPIAWRPGEVVADAYEIPLPAGLPPGDYRPLVIVYDPGTGAEWGRIELDPVRLEGNPSRPPRRALEASVAHTVHARFGDVELLGYTPPDPGFAHRPGDPLPLALLWQAAGQPVGEWQVSFWLEDVDGYPVGQEPVGGRFPVDQWAQGQLVRQWPDLYVPDRMPAGVYRLMMRLTRDGQPVPWGKGWLPLGSDLELGLVQIDR
ncbi:MAG: DUF2723 domain-containing protein [Anaerolineae bacterium]